jgi:hypothetical protein
MNGGAVYIDFTPSNCNERDLKPENASKHLCSFGNYIVSNLLSNTWVGITKLVDDDGDD